MDFAQPLALFGLALVIPIVLLWWRIRRRGRRTLVLALRCLVLALVVLALARPRMVDTVDRLAVAFLLDVSDSIPVDKRDAALAWVRERMAQVPPDDDTGLIIFGDRASLEIPFFGDRTNRRESEESPKYQLNNIASRLSRSHTDLEAALAYTEGTFPDGMARRIVLLSDGIATRGNTMTAVQALRGSGTRLDALSIAYAWEREVLVQSLSVPAQVRLHEPFQMRAVVASTVATEAELQLLEGDAPLGDPIKVHLEPGNNLIRLNQVLEAPGYYRYELHLRSPDDGNPANNIGRADVLVTGQPHVLHLRPYHWPDLLSPVLRDGGMSLIEAEPGQAPDHPAAYLEYDAIILNNVGAALLTEGQRAAIRDAVKELGVGLVTIGGDDAFGPGGYAATALEEVLPVDLDPKNRKRMPKGALVIILHSIEFDTGNTWAVRICKAALDGLSARDEAGLVYYDHGKGEVWLFELAELGNKAKQYNLIDNCYVGDMPSYHNCFALAEKALAASDAAVKHIVLISDGDAAAPSPQLVAQLNTAKVTISTICISPHGPNDTVNMQQIATAGSGRFYELDPQTQLSQLPRIMLKEAATLRRSAYVEKPFTPIVTLPDSSILRGIGNAWPQLKGYVVTAQRDGAETILIADEQEKDPLLAIWHVGLGRSLAFTSDASTRWASGWVGWEKFAPLWQQSLRAVMSGVGKGRYPIAVEVRGGNLEATLEAVGPDGRPVVDLDVSGAILGSGGAPQHFELRQRAAGRYSGSLDGLEPGHYLVRMVYGHEGAVEQSVACGTVDYSAEFRSFTNDEHVLKQATALTGGRLLARGDDPFIHDFEATSGGRELWPWLVTAGVIALLMEIAARRLDVRLPALLRRGKPAHVAVASKPPEAARPVAAYDVKETASRPERTREGEVAKKPEDKQVLDELSKAKKRAGHRREWR